MNLNSQHHSLSELLKRSAKKISHFYKLVAILSICLLFQNKLFGQDKPWIKTDPISTSPGIEASIVAAPGFTGASDISLPIYEIKLKGLNLPINLRYDNSGVKVQSIASWVGLNWTLDIGASISRVVNGTPDDVIKDVSSLYPNMDILSQKEFGFMFGGGTAANNFTDVGKTNNQVFARLHAKNIILFQMPFIRLLKMT